MLGGADRAVGAEGGAAAERFAPGFDPFEDPETTSSLDGQWVRVLNSLHGSRSLGFVLLEGRPRICHTPCCRTQDTDRRGDDDGGNECSGVELDFHGQRTPL